MESELAEAKQQQAAVSAELTSLHSHYASLHAAYTTLSAQTPSGESSGREAELGSQLQQQLATMAVLVEEKAELQSQLRQAMDLANRKHEEKEKAATEARTAQEALSLAQRDGEASKGLQTTLGRQQTELSRLREECARLEARTVELAQDRTEAQAPTSSQSEGAGRFDGARGPASA